MSKSKKPKKFDPFKTETGHAEWRNRKQGAWTDSERKKARRNKEEKNNWGV